MSKTETINVSVLRYQPEQGGEPSWQTWPVPYNSDWSVLDALCYISDKLDSTLSYRWSCRMAVCGSCGMMIDGVPKLACETFIKDYPNGFRCEALENFDIERDLIVDTEPFMRKLEAVKPWIIRHDEKPLSEGEHIQTPAQHLQYQQFAECINCTLCYAACPQIALNKDFIGPAALALAFRYNKDSRDQGKKARIEIINDNNGLWPCTFVGYCSEVCPKSVDPASAIQQSKLDGTLDWAVSFMPKAFSELLYKDNDAGTSK